MGNGFPSERIQKWQATVFLLPESSEKGTILMWRQQKKSDRGRETGQERTRITEQKSNRHYMR